MSAPRAEMTGGGATRFVVVDEQEAIPSHVAAVPGIGDVLFHHAMACNIAEISVNHGADRIVLMLATRGCTCGCGSRGRGLLLTPGAEEARIIAAQLIDLADRHEAEAKAAATAALRKAAGK